MPRGQKRKTDHDDSLLSMALVGYEQAKAKIETEITAIRKALGAAVRSYTKSAAEVEEPATNGERRKRSKMSAAARKRIGDATRARWAAAREVKNSTSKKTTSKKRLKLSAAERARISGGQAKAKK